MTDVHIKIGDKVWSIKSGGPAEGDPQGSSLGPTSQHIHRPPGWGAEEWGEKIYISSEVVEGIKGVKSCREVWYWVNWAIKWQLKVILGKNSDMNGEKNWFFSCGVTGSSWPQYSSMNMELW